MDKMAAIWVRISSKSCCNRSAVALIRLGLGGGWWVQQSPHQLIRNLVVKVLEGINGEGVMDRMRVVCKVPGLEAVGVWI